MSALVLMGVGCGLGLTLIVRGLWPGPGDLAAAVRRLDRVGRAIGVDHPSGAAATRRRPVTDRLAALMTGRLGSRVDIDLVVMDRRPEQFALQKVGTALALGGVVVALALVLQLAGTPLGTGLSFATATCAVAGGFMTPDLTLRAHAADRRAAFRHALSSYLDLVNVLLAGGAGIETSLQAAAEAGDGWAFIQIRHALVRARTLRQSPWECLIDLGDRIGVAELSEVAASVKLAGEQGARVKLSLAARAGALRAQQMARVEADAQAATERMGLPTVLMFLGFMVLLGYPAMQQIVHAL